MDEMRMIEQLTVAPRKDMHTFMNFPLVTDLDSLEADVAIMGIAYSDPYTIDEVTNDQTNAPTAIRRESARISPRKPLRWAAGRSAFRSGL